MKNIINPNEQIRDIVCDGVGLNLIYIEEALSLSRFANQIRAPRYDAFFLGLESMAIRTWVSQMAGMFEKPNPKYRIRSIPAAIEVLQSHSDTVSIPQRAHLIKVLDRFGVHHVKDFSNKQLTDFVADFFKRQISKDYPEGINNANAIKSIKGIRDKIVAHPESVHISQLPQPTSLQIDRLIVFVKVFLRAIGTGYGNAFYEDDEGNHCATRHAKQATACLQQLLMMARIFPA